MKAGVKELLVISPSTSAYGLDIKYAASKWGDKEVRAKFIDLAAALGELGVWVRLHYVYPYPHVDEVIPLMAERKVLPYLDIPFQHASPEVLKRMKRPAAQEKTLERIERWRRDCPDLTLRSTFIVGFPGETDADFEILLDWLEQASLDRVGCFKYEPVRGAAANDLAAPVPDEVKEQRWHRFMQAQQKISARRLRRKVGTRQKVIIDEVGPMVAKGRQVRCARDRRRGLCHKSPAAPRRRDRDGQNRTCRRIRPARDRGGLLKISLLPEPEILDQLLLLDELRGGIAAVVVAVHVSRLLIKLRRRLEIGGIFRPLLERVMDDLGHCGIHSLRPGNTERRV